MSENGLEYFQQQLKNLFPEDFTGTDFLVACKLIFTRLISDYSCSLQDLRGTLFAAHNGIFYFANRGSTIPPLKVSYSISYHQLAVPWIEVVAVEKVNPFFGGPQLEIRTKRKAKVVDYVVNFKYLFSGFVGSERDESLDVLKKLWETSHFADDVKATDSSDK